MLVFRIGNDLSNAVTLVNTLSTQLNETIKLQVQQLKEREERWSQLEKKVEQVASQAPTKVVFDVGGKRFAASKSTLLSMPGMFQKQGKGKGEQKEKENNVKLLSQCSSHTLKNKSDSFAQFELARQI